MLASTSDLCVCNDIAPKFSRSCFVSIILFGMLTVEIDGRLCDDEDSSMFVLESGNRF